MRILLIDDDKVFSEPLVWRLDQEGYEVTYCQSIEDVLDEKGKMKIPRPDCILLDIMMPRSNRYSKSETDAGKNTGLRLLADIQKETANIPVIIITILDNLNIAELQMKFSTLKDVLIKPVTPTVVIETIRRFLPGND
jgi:CheY-like chemotaxis protein